LIPTDTVQDFATKFDGLTSSKCGPHKSNGSGSKRSMSAKDENGLFGQCCPHGIMSKALFIRKMGERFVHGTLLLRELIGDHPWLKNGMLSYDLMCKFKGFIEV
jgi:hypothetical protein